MTASTTSDTTRDLERLYGPVASDLPLVADKIRSITDATDFVFLQKMLESALAGTGKMMRPAIALMGTNLSERQAELIMSHFSPDTRIVLAFDDDPAGHKCADLCLTTLGRHFWVKSVPYPELLEEFKRRQHPPDKEV